MTAEKRLVERRPHGAVYLVTEPTGRTLRLEEIELPAGFSTADEACVRKAMEAFPGMLLEFADRRARLLVPQPEGCWLETRIRWREPAPSGAELGAWTLGVARLARDLIRDQNPLAGECLRPEAWFLGQDGELRLLDPGLGRLLWGEAHPATLSAFGRLVDHWTERSGELATSYVWMIARCTSERPEQNYPDFCALVQALEDRPRVLAGAAEYHTRKPMLEGFQVPRLAERKERVTPIVASVLAGLSLAGLLLWSWLSRPAPPRSISALALLQGTRVELLDPASGKVLSQAPPAVALAASPGLLYLSLQDSSRILVLDDRTLQPAGAALITEGPAERLCLSPDGKWLYAWIPQRGCVVVYEPPGRAAFLYLFSGPGQQFAPGPVAGKPGLLLVDPAGSRLEARDLETGRLVAGTVLPLSGPAAADGRGGWWVASGRRLLHLDAGLSVRGERQLEAAPLGFAGGLVLLPRGVSSLEDPSRSLALLGRPVSACRAGDGSWWVGTREPDRLVHLPADLSGMLEERMLSSPPTDMVWLP